MTEATKADRPLPVLSSEGLGAGAGAGNGWPDQCPTEKPQDVRKGCAECRFAGPREGYDNYTCRRHAPLAVHDPNKHCGVYQDAFVPRWPLMGGRDWCGDFESA
jgi:hypothetical protein